MSVRKSILDFHFWTGNPLFWNFKNVYCPDRWTEWEGNIFFFIFVHLILYTKNTRKIFLCFNFVQVVGYEFKNSETQSYRGFFSHTNLFSNLITIGEAFSRKTQFLLPYLHVSLGAFERLRRGLKGRVIVDRNQLFLSYIGQQLQAV